MRIPASICFATLLGLLASSSSAWAEDPPGKLLFISNRDGNAQIYIMNTDGSGQRALTAGTEENIEPAWSPDGVRIAFTSYRDGNAEIYVMDADGSNQTRLTTDKFSDTTPAWTPDGRIVFRSMRDHWSNFFVMDANGGNLRRLTDSKMDKGAPILSPDGKNIAFIGHIDQTAGGSQIFIMPTTGGETKNLTGALSKDQKFFPSWSPDSKRIAYLVSKGLSLNIHVIDADGGHPGKITDNAVTNANPVWSPDGLRIAFVSSREGTPTELARGDIYVMNADGSGGINLTRNPYEDNYPAWSADGTSLYFVSFRDGTAQIYSIPAQGGEQRRLTRNPGYDLMIKPQVTQMPNPQAKKIGLVAAPTQISMH